MIPILYKNDETTFTSMGLGVIDCISCTVTEELNGKFVLNLETHINDRLLDKIKVDNVIMAQPRKNAEPEPFRISKVEVSFNGIVKVEAQHISYQLNYILANGMDKTFRNNTVHSSPPVWFNEFIAHRVDMSTPVPFTLVSDITDKPHKMETWDSVLPFKSLMQGREGSLLDLYGGEFSYSFYTVALNKRRGRDRNFRVAYGENMQSMKYSDEGNELYTGAVGFWRKSDGNEDCIRGNIVNVENASSFAYPRIAAVDFSADYDEQPTPEQLTSKTQSYIKSHQYGKPTISMSVKVGFPSEGSEYWSRASQMVNRDDLELGDTIRAIYTPAGIEMYSRVTSIVYDVLTEKNKDVIVGNIKKKASSVLAKLM